MSRPKKAQHCIRRRKYHIFRNSAQLDEHASNPQRRGQKVDDPSQWEDRGTLNCCWLNYQVDGDGSFQVNVCLGKDMGSWGIEQKNGILLRQYDRSHLCANWCCMNHRHHFIEPDVRQSISGKVSADQLSELFILAVLHQLTSNFSSSNTRTYLSLAPHRP